MNQNNSNLNNHEEFNNTSNHNSNKNFTQKGTSLANFKDILEIVLTCLFLFAIIFLLANKKTDNTKLLEKYTYIPPEKYQQVYKNIDYETVDIKHVTKRDLFDGGYAKFYIEDNNYELLRSIDELHTNIYQNSNGKRFALMYRDHELINLDFDSLKNDGFISDEFLSKYPEINIISFLNRNEIKTNYDLIYKSIINYNNMVDSKSTKNEIIDNFLFNYFLPLVVPYNNESQLHKFVFYTGDIRAYAVLQDTQYHLFVENDNYELDFIFDNDNLLTLDEIKDIVSTIEF